MAPEIKTALLDALAAFILCFMPFGMWFVVWLQEAMR